MTTETFKIEKIENKVSKKNMPYIKVNGKYSVFEKDLIDTINKNVGNSFNFEIAESNGFFNIRSMGEQFSTPVVPMNATPIATPNQELAKHKDISIARMSALKSAVDFCKDRQDLKVLDTAEEFLKFIIN